MIIDGAWRREMGQPIPYQIGGKPKTEAQVRLLNNTVHDIVT